MHHSPVHLANPLRCLGPARCCRWSLQKDFVTLPKSVNPERQAQNLDVFGFELSAQEVAELDTLEEGLVTGWNPIKDDAV